MRVQLFRVSDLACRAWWFGLRADQYKLRMSCTERKRRLEPYGA